MCAQNGNASCHFNQNGWNIFALHHWNSHVLPYVISPVKYVVVEMKKSGT